MAAVKRGCGEGKRRELRSFDGDLREGGKDRFSEGSEGGGIELKGGGEVVGHIGGRREGA